MRRSLGAGLAAFAAMSATTTIAAEGGFAKALDAELAAIVADPARALASLSVLAVRSGKVVYQRQFGRRFIDAANPAHDRPANAATLYRIASISKLVTAIAAMKLVEDGTLSLDADVSGVLGWRLRNPHFPDSPITLRMLLSHTSSLRDDGGYFWDAGVALKDVLAPGGPLYGSGAMWAANAAPGKYFQYANLPWGVVGTILERASGERFDRLVKRLVLDPLGIAGGFNPAEFTAQELADTATLYRKRTTAGDKETWDPAGPWVAQVDDYSREAPVPRAGPNYVIGSNGTLFGPQGNLRVSADGLGRIMRMLMNGGTLDGQRVLAAQSVDTMLAEQWRSDGRGGNGQAAFGAHADYFNAWGLGNQHFLDIGGPGRGDRLVEGGGLAGVGHIGDAWGLTSLIAFDRKTRDGVIFLVGGPGFDPATDPGRYSARYGYEERIVTALWRRAVRGVTTSSDPAPAARGR